jgi:hypothetical protein
MPKQTVTIFAFASAWVGDNSATTTPLTQITALRTNGATLKENQPRDYQYILLNDIQSGNCTFTIDLDFYTDALQTTVLTRGLPVNTGTINSPLSNNLYSLLLVAPNQLAQSSYFFPKARTTRSRELAYKKDGVTTTRVTFTCEDRSPNTTLFYQDTLSNLISVMGSQSPF